MSSVTRTNAKMTTSAIWMNRNGGSGIGSRAAVKSSAHQMMPNAMAYRSRVKMADIMAMPSFERRTLAQNRTGIRQ
jgi:hypothetical protein